MKFQLTNIMELKIIFNETALLYATYKNHAEVVKLLLSHKNIDVNIVDKISNSIFMNNIQ